MSSAILISLLILSVASASSFRVYQLYSGLPILMYHKILDDKSDALTVSTTAFEEQLAYLTKTGYRSLFLSELNTLTAKDKKCVCLTFDDGFANNLTNAVPLLEKYGIKANFMIITGYLGELPDWYPETERLMNLEELRICEKNPLLELNLHTFHHRNFETSSIDEITADTAASLRFIAENNLVVNKAISYPFGRYPKPDGHTGKFEKMVAMLQENGISCALRIGNRKNKLPLSSPYILQRIDINGIVCLSNFKRLLNFGAFKI